MTAWADLGITPGPVLRVFGMRRSGNHAVINWLGRNAPGGRSVFFNNCTPGRNPFETFRAVEVNGRRRPGRAEDGAAGFASHAGDGAAVIFSYEDAMPNERRRQPVSAGMEERRIDLDVIICRGFLNWAASLARKLQGNPGYTPAQRVSIVLKSVGLYGRMLDLVIAESELGLVTIRYDDWMAAPGYRARLLERLGFERRDDTLGEVQRYGNGSSFQDDAPAEELRTADRWREMGDDPEYRIVLWLAAQDAELLQKLSRVFPDDAGKLALLTDEPVPTALPGQAGDEQPPARSAALDQILRRN
ncbi:hypothetical protein [Roseovarius salis]|uniref:hypothetical protein n=1 Tax=Roseovarius salis TaxID=3376063 RepID=UPI0037C83A37